MNTTIKRLAEQALMSSMVHDQMYRPEGYAHAVSKQFADKFAELIIRECARVVDNKTDFGNAYGWTDEWAEGADLLKHFGIEN